MIKTKRLLLFTGLLIFGGLFLAMSDNPLVVELTRRLKTVTMEKHVLELQNSDLRYQIAELKIAKKDDLIALEPMRYFKEKGDVDFLNVYPFDIDHMRYVLKCIDKYEYLLTPEARESAAKDKINMRHFMLCWCAKESRYNRFAKHTCKNGSIDVTLYQINKGINDVVWKGLYSRLPEELKKIKDPENSIEVGTAMMYLWINDRVKLRWSWAFLSYTSEGGFRDGKYIPPKQQDWAWTLYWRLGRIDCP